MRFRNVSDGIRGFATGKDVRATTLVLDLWIRFALDRFFDCKSHLSQIAFYFARTEEMNADFHGQFADDKLWVRGDKNPANLQDLVSNLS